MYISKQGKLEWFDGERVDSEKEKWGRKRPREGWKDACAVLLIFHSFYSYASPQIIGTIRKRHFVWVWCGRKDQNPIFYAHINHTTLSVR